MSPSEGARRSVVFGVTIDYQLRYHDGLYQRLADDGWEVHLIAGPGPIGDRLSTYRGIFVHRMQMARNPDPVVDLRSLVHWVRLLRSIRPQAAVAGTPKAGLLGTIAARLTGVRSRIYELHGLRLESSSGGLRRMLLAMEKFACWAASDVLAVSPSLRARAIAERVVPSNKVRVLGDGSPNGVDVRRFAGASADSEARAATRAVLGLPINAPVVTFVGRLTADKGLDALTVAMAGLEEDLPAAHLLIVGAADDESGALGLDRLRSTLTRVTFAGEVEDVAPYLAITDVLCLPSRREGLPTVVLEAFAAGVPVVATEATGIIDLVRDGETGFLVPIDDGRALGRALARALKERATTRAIVRRARDEVGRRYAEETVQRRWKHELEAAISR
ncbi:glycosyltransferase family 4 protein [Microbacterium sp. NPDC057650]|uniref:glycosyltransferase family 4 protein n=1 Tax=unclassified Microbacterium TaxID=2609290 RepID=UPI00366D05D0